MKTQKDGTAMNNDIQEAKRLLPLPKLMEQCGLGKHAKKSARCPFHKDGSNSFSVYERAGDLGWGWKCFSGCGGGDEITFLELHEGLSNKDATKRFLDMSGVRSGRTAGEQRPSVRSERTDGGNSKPAVEVKPFNWQPCVDAFTDEYVAKLAKWRGYSLEFCQWLKEQSLVGLHENNIAFPVHDAKGGIVAAHVKSRLTAKDGTDIIPKPPKWIYRYNGKNGSGAQPLIIGDLSNAKMVSVFESQWDAFAVCDKLDMHIAPGFAVIITRGSENGGFVAGLIPADADVLAWPQNDPEDKRNAKTGKTPAEKWLATVAEKAGAKVRSVLTPSIHKDANDWTRAGATMNDIMEAVGASRVIAEQPGLPVEARNQNNAPDSALVGESRSGVALADTLSQIENFLCRYIAFRYPEQPKVIALWLAHSHALDAFDYTPYLHPHSPEKRCGKSRLLDCCNLLVPRPWLCVQPSEAVVYRKIAASCPTLLLDEVDTIFCGGKDENKEGLRALLNAGFNRGATVPRCVGPKHEIKDFPVFCAKVIAGIGKLPDTVADRSIPIVLARKARDQVVERFRTRDVTPHAAGIRAALEKWATDSDVIGALRTARPALPDALGDRQQDICEPLLAIADMAGGDWPEDARLALTALFGAADTSDESVGAILLAAIREIFADKKETKLPTEKLLDELIERDDGPWASWWGGDIQYNNYRGPSTKLARLLRPFGITSATIRLGDETMKGYKSESFADAWARYLSPPK